MEKTIAERVTIYEGYSEKIANFLWQKGYGVANHGGERVEKVLPSSILEREIGILRFKIPKYREATGAFARIRNQRGLRDEHIGTLYMENEVYGAIPGEKWVLAVYGRSNLSELTGLAKEITKESNMNVMMRLDSEDPKLEHFATDFDE